MDTDLDDLLFARFQENLARCPDKPVFIFPGRKHAWETITYRELAERAEVFARGLSAWGIQPGMRAVMMAPPSLDFFALAIAMLQIRVVPIIADPSIGLFNVTRCLAECAPDVYFGSALTHGLRLLLGWGRDSLRLNLSLADVARAGQGAPPVRLGLIDPHSEAAILYTSGSTGLSKGVIYSRENFAAQIEQLRKALDVRGDELDMPAFPVFALIDALLGVTAVIPDMRFPPPGQVDPARMFAAIQTWQVDTLFVSPAALARLARYGIAGEMKLPSLRKVITAGAPAPLDVQEQFVTLLSSDAELFGIYGSTETLPVSIVSSREVLNETRHLSARGAGVCIGYPVAGAEVSIIPISDDALNLAEAISLPAGEVGEIAVKGPTVTKEYVGRAHTNHLAKIHTTDGKIIHRMGDLGYFDEQGRLWYCGRKSHRVVTPAGTLFTEPIEGVFNAHPLVYRTALVGVEKGGSTEPGLWVELHPSARSADRNKIRAELFEMARTHESARSIRQVWFHKGFPTDVRHNSKIIREKLALEAKKQC
jgi:acyl-CoA synthetase (AMP-forming)/AMP-acid ligase II